MSSHHLTTQSLKERFESHISMEPNTGCWLYTGAEFKSGYGHFGTEGAHRTAYELYIGPIPEGLCVLHKCDTRICCSPYHIFAGTKLDNSQDCLAKGRFNLGSRGRPGILRYNHKLTEKQVLEIRADSRSLGVISEEHGVSRMLISRIKRGKAWSHLS